MALEICKSKQCLLLSKLRQLEKIDIIPRNFVKYMLEMNFSTRVEAVLDSHV